MENNDFTPSKNYFAMWRAAKKIENIDNMELIFNALCAEIGYNDPDRDQAQAALGQKAAEYKNNQGKGPEAKKV